MGRLLLNSLEIKNSLQSLYGTLENRFYVIEIASKVFIYFLPPPKKNPNFREP